MSSLSEVFQVLTGMREAQVIEDYAVGGAMAVLFYAEPTRTYDLDVFVLLPKSSSPLLSLSPLYEWLKPRGFEHRAEHVLIHGVPVQFLPAYNELAEEAVKAARLLDYEGVPVRVAPPEHLIALSLQAGGRKRRERAFQLLEAGVVDRPSLEALLDRHGISAGDLFHE